MKKVAFVFMLASFTSLFAAASNDVIASPGDPKKEQQQQPSFTLAKGYFSLFNIFSIPAPVPDTSRTFVPSQTPQPQLPKKQ